MKSIFADDMTRTKSIKDMLRISFIAIIGLFIVPTIISLVYLRNISAEYNRLIENIDFANELSNTAKTEVNKEIWEIVAGRKSFSEGRQYEIINTINEGLSVLHANTGEKKNLELIEAARRATGTLITYVDRLSSQIKNRAPVSENQQILIEIQGVSALIYDVLKEFTYAEINMMAKINISIQHTSRLIALFVFILVCIVTMTAGVAYKTLEQAIKQPIWELEKMAEKIALGNLETRAKPPDVEELIKLTESLNIMAERISALLENSIEEQKNLQKSEMRELQAQITPHFLYNTFDTIVWLAEEGRTQEVVDVTMAFSNFYRIALSHGHDWIPVSKEIEHVKDYLVIQSVRYMDILSYTIDIDEELKDKVVIKLILQPLVENALYHGIKNKRGGGHINVSGRLLADQNMLFVVEDNGIGMTKETLLKLKKSLSADHPSENAGYGIFNVNRRIKLFYGIEGLSIESEYGRGTKLSLGLPLKEEQKDV